MPAAGVHPSPLAGGPCQRMTVHQPSCDRLIHVPCPVQLWPAPVAPACPADASCRAAAGASRLWTSMGSVSAGRDSRELEVSQVELAHDPG